MTSTTKPKRTANHSAWKYVDKCEEFQGSSLRGEIYREGFAPHLSGNATWMSAYETERYADQRNRITYIVWSFYTPIAYFVEGSGWYKVGQSFSSYTGRHRSGALRNVPGHTVTLTGKPGDWNVECKQCGTTRHFTRRRDAEPCVYNHR